MNVRAHRVRLSLGLVASAALVFVLASAAAPSHAGAPAPGVLLASFPKPLLGFAHDGSRIAWAQAPCGSVVAIRNLASGGTWKAKDHGADCEPGFGFFGGLALGGRRAVWATGWVGDFSYNELESGIVGSQPTIVVPDGVVTGGDFPGETSFGDCDGGDLITDHAADEGVAVYSYVAVNGDLDNCRWLSISGGVYSVATGAQIPGLPPAYAVAVGDGLIAVIPVGSDLASKSLAPKPSQPVYVYDTGTQETRTVPVEGAARYVAVSRSTVAVLAKSSAGQRIERSDARSGAPIGSTPVPSTTNPYSLSVSGKRIVYSTKQGIWLLAAASGKRTLITATAHAPIGLSIDGNHVYWAENQRRRGRILTLKLP